jgi:putative sugar O-methyltransferase
MIENNLALLEEMQSFQNSAPQIYKPTNYWKVYEDRFLPYLKKYGLSNFRSGQYEPGGEILFSFGAASGPFLKKPKWRQFVFRVLTYGAKRSFLPAPNPNTFFPKESIKKVKQRVQKELIDLQRASTQSLRSLNEMDVSVFGEPAILFENNGKKIDYLTLDLYSRCAYVANFIDFNKINTIVELGSGSGAQAELIAKLHPNITLILVDVSPQLYVAHQYLSAVFPDRVVKFNPSYSITDLKTLRPGAIYFLANWQINLISGPIDLFWSSQSFAEMEPLVVKNYLEIAGNFSNSMYLQQVFSGKHLAPKKGILGVLEKTTFKDYKDALHNFNLLSRKYVSKKSSYEHSFWDKASLLAANNE